MVNTRSAAVALAVALSLGAAGLAQAAPCGPTAQANPAGNGRVDTASAKPEGNGRVDTASAKPEGNGRVDTASAKPEGNGRVDTASADCK